MDIFYPTLILFFIFATLLYRRRSSSWLFVFRLELLCMWGLGELFAFLGGKWDLHQNYLLLRSEDLRHQLRCFVDFYLMMFFYCQNLKFLHALIYQRLLMLRHWNYLPFLTEALRHHEKQIIYFCWNCQLLSTRKRLIINVFTL